MQFFFITNESELDYYQQNMNVRVASRIAERLKAEDIREVGNFKKIPENLEIDNKCPTGHPKAKSQQLCKKITKNLL